MQRKNSKSSGIKTLCLVLALIPFLALITIIANLIINSIPAIQSEGWSELFSSEYSGIYGSGKGIYGLLPGLWGTFMVVLIAMAIAAPISFAIAIVTTDFSLGFISNGLRWIMGILSGIPPIIYAVIGTTFFNLFIIPKFLGLDLPYESRLPPGMLPSDSSCTLLGGFLLALLIIPFLSPLIEDAIHNVPNSLKEASFALGANRWYTLTTVTLPSALSGISDALILGVLIAMGDAIIVAYVIGMEVGSLPTPIFDVLERIAPLTSTAAGLAGGGFSRAEVGPPVQKSVANFIGLLLLVIAFAVLGISAYLKKRLKQRLNP